LSNPTTDEHVAAVTSLLRGEKSHQEAGDRVLAHEPMVSPVIPEDEDDANDDLAQVSEEHAAGDATARDEPEAVQAEEEEPPRVTVKDLAERLGLEPRDIYDELEIPLGDGQSVTLGEWKDRVKELRAVDLERDQVKQSRESYERDLMRTRQEVNALMALIPEQARAQLIHQARERSTAYEAEQRKAVLDAIPDWQNPDRLAADREAIVAMGAEFGFSEQEITWTQDARTVRMLHDFMRLRERVASIDIESKRQAAVTKKSAPGTKQAKGRKLAQVIAKAKASGDRRDKEAAVAQLIRGMKQ